MTNTSSRVRPTVLDETLVAPLAEPVRFGPIGVSIEGAILLRACITLPFDAGREVALHKYGYMDRGRVPP